MGYGDFGLYRPYTPFLDKSVLKITPITLIVYIPKSRLFVRVIYILYEHKAAMVEIEGHHATVHSDHRNELCP